MVDEILYKELRELLNGPFETASDDSSNGFRVDIWAFIPQVKRSDPTHDIVNFGPLCLGTYLVEGKDDTISSHLNRKLKDILDSVINESPPELQDRLVQSNYILVVDGKQYFFDIKDKKVFRRKDEHRLAFRNNLNLFPTSEKGITIVGLTTTMLGISRLHGVEETNATLDGLTEWGFPSFSWVPVDGVYQVDRTYIKGCDKVEEILVPNSFHKMRGVIGKYLPVHVRFTDGSQHNYFGKEEWRILSKKLDSMKDLKDSMKAPDIKYVVIGTDGKTESRWIKDTTVKAKVDYWNNEALRVRYFRDVNPYPIAEAGDENKLEVGTKLKNGDNVVSFYVPTSNVEIPTLLTSFDSKNNPKLVDSKDGELVIETSEKGKISVFKVRKGNRYSNPKDYEFALLGNQMGGIPELPSWTVSNTDRVKKLEEMAAKNLTDIVIDDLRTAKSRFKVKESLGGKAIRRITITKFDINLNPLEFGIENDEGDKIMMAYGSNPDTFFIRFDIPSSEHLKEIEDYYNDIAAQMEGKSKIRATDIDAWRKKNKTQEDVFKSVSSKVKIVSGGLSGLTMINSDKLNKGETVEIRGV